MSLIENGFRNASESDTAPANFEDAYDQYRQALELTGTLCAQKIAPLSASADKEGARLDGGKVIYPSASQEAWSLLAKSGFTGVLLPREFGGAQFPGTIYTMMIEMVSRADASLMTLFGYQDVGELVARYADKQVADKFLPGYCAGTILGSMVLTEPHAGSDLQAIKVTATINPDGEWRLNGVKRFISNGGAEMLLVLARSEPDVNGIFGLSLFVCPGGDEVRVARIEEKMGLHASPTCELHFDDAPAHLVGERRMGLLKYVPHAFNQARFSVAAQALGIAEAAYAGALEYAQERKSFGRRLFDIAAVSEMLISMRVRLESCRALLYEGTQRLDLQNQLEIALSTKSGDQSKLHQQFRQLVALTDLSSPMTKYFVTEQATRVCHDAQQVFGGMGYMRETGIEQLVRDIRITTIYEGTSQIQIASCIRHILRDVFEKKITAMQSISFDHSQKPLASTLASMRADFLNALVTFRTFDNEMRNAAAREIVDMYAYIYVGYLVLSDSNASPRKLSVARTFILGAEAEVTKSKCTIENGRYSVQLDKNRICLDDDIQADRTK